MQRMAPCLMFVGEQCGKAEEAMELYVSAFADTAVLDVERFGPEEGERGINRARFPVAGHELVPLQAYDFSAKFGWLQDRFGVTWQLNLV
jgi:predicted 3-demethylubiquinone-9 3-methyltransferase (glyoxalase superfamily)